MVSLETNPFYSKRKKRDYRPNKSAGEALGTALDNDENEEDGEQTKNRNAHCKRQQQP